MMNLGHRGIIAASIGMKTFGDMVNTLPSAESPFDRDNILINSEILVLYGTRSNLPS